MGHTIGVDIRSLGATYRTGVGEYVFELLREVLSAPSDDRFILWSNGAKRAPDALPFQFSHVRYVHTRVPNKLLHASVSLLGAPALDTFIARATNTQPLDLFFSPNVHFTAVRSATPHVMTVHDISFLRHPQFFSPVSRVSRSLYRLERQLMQAAAVVVPSHFVAEELVDRFSLPRERIRVVSPGVAPIFTNPEAYTDDAKWRVRSRYRLPAKFILFLGTIEPRKNIQTLVEAFVLMQKKGTIDPDTHLVIAGAPGWLYADIMRTFMHDERIHYIHYVQSEDRPALYALADVFVYPSLYEGFGLPLLEAFAAGTPVVTSNRTSMPEVAERAAYLMDPTRLDDLMGGIATVLADRNLRSHLVAAGRARLETYTWASAARTLRQCFLDVLR